MEPFYVTVLALTLFDRHINSDTFYAWLTRDGLPKVLSIRHCFSKMVCNPLDSKTWLSINQPRQLRHGLLTSITAKYCWKYQHL